MAALVMVGILALKELPTAALPSVESPIIEVSTKLPGASPDVMASTVTNPLETRLSQIPGVVSLRSASSFGISSITLEFTLSRNIDAAAQDVQAAISASAGQLPRTLPNPPIYHKVNPADPPIMMLAMTSQTLPLPRVNEFAETLLGQKLAQVPGVGFVALGGDQKRALRIRLNPQALANVGLSLNDVRNQIALFNVNAPKGSIDGTFQAFAIGADDQMVSAEAYLDLIVGQSNGAPIRLREVGKVEEGIENERASGWYNNLPAIIISVRRQPGANVIATVDRIKEALPNIYATLPAGIKLEVVSDRSQSIRASIAGISEALVHTIVIVIAVIFLFLRRLWATIIPSATLPLSLIGTFALMYLFNFSINNLSLMALTIAAGFVVDDAIVMVENIFRHMENGETPEQAAINGSRQISFTVISLTASLVAVFVPLIFMEGVVGRLFREFSLTIAVAVIVSAIVSLAFTPMLCSKLLRRLPPRPDRKQAFFDDFGFSALQRGYAASLGACLNHPSIILAVTFLSLVASVVLFVAIPKGLLPASGQRRDCGRDGCIGRNSASDDADSTEGIDPADPVRSRCNVRAGFHRRCVWRQYT